MRDLQGKEPSEKKANSFINHGDKSQELETAGTSKGKAAKRRKQDGWLNEQSLLVITTVCISIIRLSRFLCFVDFTEITYFPQFWQNPEELNFKDIKPEKTGLGSIR